MVENHTKGIPERRKKGKKSIKEEEGGGKKAGRGFNFFTLRLFPHSLISFCFIYF